MLWAQSDSQPLFQWTLAPLFEDYGIPLAIMGVLVVYLALTLIILFISLLPRIFVVRPAATGHPVSSSLLIDPNELSDEEMAVLAAAVAEAMGKPQRIVKIRGLTPAELGWSLEGRMQHHQSHRIQRRP